MSHDIGYETVFLNFFLPNGGRALAKQARTAQWSLIYYSQVSAILTHHYAVLMFQMEAEVGVIEKVTLQNFMCHKFLEIGFGSNVNFIIGKNGSMSSLHNTVVLPKKILGNSSGNVVTSIFTSRNHSGAYWGIIFKLIKFGNSTNVV